MMKGRPSSHSQSTARRRQPGQHHAATNSTTMKRTFYVWVLLASCFFVSMNQFRQTKHAVRVMEGKEDASESPYFSLPHQHHNNNANVNNNKSKENDRSNNSKDRHLDSLTVTDKASDNDAKLEDDNVFDDDSTMGDDSTMDDEDKEEDDDELQDNTNNAKTTAKDISSEEDEKETRKQIDQQAARKGGRVGKNFADAYQQAVKRKQIQQQQLQPQPLKLSYQEELEQRKDDVLKRQGNVIRKRKKNKRARGNVNWRPPQINTTDFSKEFPILPMDDRIMPDMTTAKGGVIFFLHIPKTGGQTIRQFNLKFRSHLQRRAAQDGLRGGVPRKAAEKKKDTAPSPEQTELDELTRKRLKFVAANKLSVFQEIAIPQINSYFATAVNETATRKVLFVEVHGMDNYHALELEPYIHYWREQSQKTGIPFFSFTLLREAISMQVSFFNYYYIHPGDPRFCVNPLKPKQKCGAPGAGARGTMMRRRPRGSGLGLRDKYMEIKARIKRGENVPQSHREALRFAEDQLLLGGGENHANGIENVSHETLEETMLKLAYDNPQCLFLARGERTYGDGTEQKHLRETKLGRIECQQTYLSMQRTMDWVGRTDTLSTETLPLLTHIMFGKPELGKHLPKANSSPIKGGYVELSKIQPSTLKALEGLSQFDQELYHRTIQDFSMDQWVNSTDTDVSR